MSTIARPARIAQPTEAGEAATAIIRWDLARTAAARSLTHLLSGQGHTVGLEWLLEPVRGEGVRGEARLIDGGTATTLLSVPEAGPGRWLEGPRGMVHIDIPGLLCATLQRRSGTTRVRYARTGLLAIWGVPGGRYQVESGADMASAPRL
jgi:hypothetical protein